MKLNGSLLCHAVLGITVFACGVACAQDAAPPVLAQAQGQTLGGQGRGGGQGGAGAAARAAAPYHESPTAYQENGPIGCVGCPATVAAARAAAAAPQAAQGAAPRRVGPQGNNANPLPYDLLLQGGHVIDAKNNVDKVTDVGIKDGKIAAVGDNLRTADALKTIDVKGLVVTPGLIDIHMHVYASTGERGSYAGDDSIWPDGFTFRNGVTTVVDAGSSGWRNFEDFKEHIIDRSMTRVLVDLNIVGAGMRGGRYEDNLADMQGEPTAWMAERYPGIIVGVKSAHFTGPEWTPYIEAVKAGNMAHIPVMIDYGDERIERPLYDLLTKYLRPGDIYTHAFSGLRGEQDPRTLLPQKGLIEGRARGVYFDIGAGGGSFRFRVAVPFIKSGFQPDSLSTDLHIGSMNSSTKDMLNVMSKFMAMGETLQEVVAQSTWHPAREIKQMQLGNFDIGAPADVAVLREQKGKFGYTDMDNVKLMGDIRLVCELTLRNGRVIYDLNGISMDSWNQLTPSSPVNLAGHWSNYHPRTPLPEQLTPTQK